MVSLISNTNNSIYYKSFVCTQLNGSKYCYVSITIQLNISHLFIQLNVKIVLFQTIQFSISTQFKCQTVLFDPKIRPYQVLSLQTRVDLRAMKKYSAFPKAPLLDLVSYSGHSLEGSYPSAETQIMHSATPANWATWVWGILKCRNLFMSNSLFSFHFVPMPLEKGLNHTLLFSGMVRW